MRPLHPQRLRSRQFDSARQPQDQSRVAYPAGQWEYWLFYQEHFDGARATFEANVDTFVRALFRKGDPAGQGNPSFMAEVRRDIGWFGGADEAPSVPCDADVITEQDLSVYVASFTRTGFFGPDSWYMNDAANIAYAAQAKNGGALTLPVLFLHAPYDYTCETMDFRFAEPMRRDGFVTLPCDGHEVSAAHERSGRRDRRPPRAHRRGAKHAVRLG